MRKFLFFFLPFSSSSPQLPFIFFKYSSLPLDLSFPQEHRPKESSWSLGRWITSMSSHLPSQLIRRLGRSNNHHSWRLCFISGLCITTTTVTTTAVYGFQNPQLWVMLLVHHWVSRSSRYTRHRLLYLLCAFFLLAFRFEPSFWFLFRVRLFQTSLILPFTFWFEF